MINVKDIFNSWIKSFNPPQKELNRAKERFEICLGCEFRKEMIENKKWTLVCGSCGCPLQAKVYSSVINPCPENKWEAVDKKYDSIPIIKNNKSFL